MKTLFIVSALLAASPAFPKSMVSKKACSVPTDCAVAEDHCGNARPLNKAYLKENDAVVGGLQTLTPCPEGSQPQAKLFTATCKDTVCVLEKAKP